MKTLQESREEDLRTAGLKMGDIIKIQRMLALHDNLSDTQSDQDLELDSSVSSKSESELELSISSTPKRQVRID